MMSREVAYLFADTHFILITVIYKVSYFVYLLPDGWPGLAILYCVFFYYCNSQSFLICVLIASKVIVHVIYKIPYLHLETRQCYDILFAI